MVPRSTKVTIHTVFIGPTLEYGSCLFDYYTSAMSDMIENVQQAALTIIGAYANTSHITFITGILTFSLMLFWYMDLVYLVTVLLQCLI